MIKRSIGALLVALCMMSVSQTAYAEEGDPVFDDGITPTPLPVLDEVPSPTDAEPLGVFGASTGVTYTLRHYASLVPQPQGYATNSCWKTVLSSSANLYMCRYVVSTDVIVAKNDATIVAASAHDSTHGTMIVHSNGTYEGCYTYYSRYWRCSFAANQHWSRLTSTDLVSNYYYAAYKNLNLVPSIKCAVGFNKVWNQTATIRTSNRLPKDCVSAVFG